MAVSHSEFWRMKMKQTPTDVWSIRERLCLASSVLRSGDQNWVSVSRAIKPFSERNRPLDWFSQKNCALQYSDLLEKVETPKRKRGERGENETPGESIVRRLTQERVEELQQIIQQDQQRYRKLKKEVELLQAGQLDDKLEGLWQEILKEKEMQELAEQKHQQWLQEREIAKQAAHAALRMAKMLPNPKKQVTSKRQVISRRNSSQSEHGSEPDSALDSPLSEPVTVDSATDDLSNQEPPNPIHLLPSPSVVPSVPTPVSSASHHSPLLNTLLRSVPQSSSPSSSTLSPTKEISPRSQVALSSPTITSLLSSNSGLTSLPSSVANLLTTALSGPPDGESTPMPPRMPVQSPSQGAPTLLKLLDMPLGVPGKLPPLPVITTAADAFCTSTITTTMASMLCEPVPSASPNPPSEPGMGTRLHMALVEGESRRESLTSIPCSLETSASSVEPLDESRFVAIEENSSLVKVEVVEPDVSTIGDAVVIDDSVEQDGEVQGISILSAEVDAFIVEEEAGDVLDVKEEEEVIVIGEEEIVGNMEDAVEIEEIIVKKEDDAEQIEECVEIFDVVDDVDIDDSVSLREADLEAILLETTRDKLEVLEEVVSEVDGDAKASEAEEEEEEEEEHHGENVSSGDVGIEPEIKQEPIEEPEARDTVDEDESISDVGVPDVSAEELETKPTVEQILEVEPESVVVKEEVTVHEETTVKSVTYSGDISPEVFSPGEVVVEPKVEDVDDAPTSPDANESSHLGEDSNGKETTKKTTQSRRWRRTGRGSTERAATASNSSPAEDSPSVLEEDKDEKRVTDDGEESAEGKMTADEEPPAEVGRGKRISRRKRDDKDSSAVAPVSEASRNVREVVRRSKEDPPPKAGGKHRMTKSLEVLSNDGDEVDDDQQSDKDDSSSAGRAPSTARGAGDSSQSEDQDSLRDYRVWKKAIMLVWRAVANHKYANVFLHPVTDEEAPGYHSVVYRSMDLQTVKKNIENGVIRTTSEFQHDIMLMFQNAIMYNGSDHDVFKMAIEMQKEVMGHIQDFVATQLMMQTAGIPVPLRRETREQSLKRSEIQIDKIQPLASPQPPLGSGRSGPSTPQTPLSARSMEDGVGVIGTTRMRTSIAHGQPRATTPEAHSREPRDAKRKRPSSESEGGKVKKRRTRADD